ncbi:ATP-binding protein [Pirellulaceae bacterium SH449]
MTYNLDSSIQQATVDLLLATLRSVQPGVDSAQWEQWFHRYAPVLGFADLVGADILQKLQALLAFLQNNSATSHSDSESRASTDSLISAVHASILAITQKTRFDQAVQEESRRQIYNFVYGLTHEINNPLANIAARAQQLMVACKDPISAKSLGTIVDQSMRAHEMLAESMNAVRPPKLAPELVDISQAIAKSIESYRKKAAAQEIEIFAHPMPANLYCTMNQDAFLESLVSLFQNAAEACRPGDRIDVVAELLEAGDPDTANLGHPGRQIRVAIRDTGRGIPAADLAKVWDLYFSGRESGRGLGISLAKARRVIESFRGKIWLLSNANTGTTVEIRLISETPPAPSRRKISIARGSANLGPGSRT